MSDYRKGHKNLKHTVTEVKLKNGAKGLLINVPSASVMAFDINFKAGYFLSEDHKWETAHIMEHMALGANQTYRSSRKFNAVLQQNGAYSNAGTNAHDIVYDAECADFEWDRIFDLMLLAISKPLFMASEFEAEVGNIHEELIQRGNNHGAQLNLELGKQLGFYAKTHHERLELLKNVTLEDVKEHYKKTHFTKNMRFVIAGPIDSQRKKAIIAKLEKVDLPEGDRGRFEMPDEIPRKLEKPVFIKNKTVPNLYFDIDTFKLGGRLSEPELYALSAVNNILNGTLHSRILGKAREQGLVYSMGSNRYWSKNYTAWGIGAQVSPNNAPELFDLVVREIKRVLNGTLDAKDLAAAKDFAIGSYQRGAQTVNSVSSRYRGLYFALDKVEDFYEFPEKVKAVTRPRAVAAYQKVFEDGIYGLGFLGTADQELRDQLEQKVASIWQ